MIIKVTGAKKIEDGVHTGVVTKIQNRTEPYEYVDLIIESEGCELKAGYPATLNPVSNLGKLLQRFGVELEIGQNVDLALMVGKKIQFQTMTEEKGESSFSKILPNSVKPAKE